MRGFEGVDGGERALERHDGRKVVEEAGKRILGSIELQARGHMAAQASSACDLPLSIMSLKFFSSSGPEAAV